jgi:hypothetical protein
MKPIYAMKIFEFRLDYGPHVYGGGVLLVQAKSRRRAIKFAKEKDSGWKFERYRPDIRGTFLYEDPVEILEYTYIE